MLPDFELHPNKMDHESVFLFTEYKEPIVAVTLVIGFVALVTAYITEQLAVPQAVGRIAERSASVFAPTNVWPFMLFIGVLTFTLERIYFPTALILVGWLVSMFYYGHITIPFSAKNALWAFVFTIGYFMTGAVWLLAKWYLFAYKSSNANIIAAVTDEYDALTLVYSRFPVMYPHLVYWPISIIHALFTEVGYTIYEFMMKKYSAIFVDIIMASKQGLTNITIATAKTAARKQV